MSHNPDRLIVPSYLSAGTNIYSVPPFEPHLSEVAEKHALPLEEIRAMVGPVGRNPVMRTNPALIIAEIRRAKQGAVGTSLQFLLTDFKAGKTPERRLEKYTIGLEIYRRLSVYPHLIDYLRETCELENHSIKTGERNARVVNDDPYQSYPAWLDTRRAIDAGTKARIYVMVSLDAFAKPGSEQSQTPTHAQTRRPSSRGWYQFRQSEATRRATESELRRDAASQS